MLVKREHSPVHSPKNVVASSENFSCATSYRRRVLLRTPGSEEPQESIGYGISSVFTPLENRRKGYAHHMMSLLHWILAPRSALPTFPEAWGTPPPEVEGYGNAKLSVLYSDVGEFYKATGPDGKATGWTTRDPVGTIWDVSKPAKQLPSDLEGIKWLDEPEVQELWKKDAQLIKEDITRPETSYTLFTFLPDVGVGGSLVQRTRFSLSSQNLSVPNIWGMSLLEDEETNPLTFATWTVDTYPLPPDTHSNTPTYHPVIFSTSCFWTL